MEPAPPSTPKNPAKVARANTREERLKSALKANMARRKAQARARADGIVGDDGVENDKENE